MTLFLVIYFTVAIVGIFLFYFKTIKPTQDWFIQCDKLEKEIKNNDNFDVQIENLYALKKKSWHRVTESRIRELALMMETKYKVEIIKRSNKP